MFQRSTQKLEYISVITNYFNFCKVCLIWGFFGFFTQPKTPQVSFFSCCCTPPHLNVHIQIISLPQNNSAAALLIVVSSKQHYSCSKSVVGIRKSGRTTTHHCMCVCAHGKHSYSHGTLQYLITSFIFFFFFSFFLP